MKVLAGLLRPSAGEVTLNAEPVTRRSADRIAYLPDTDLFLSTLQVNNYFSIMPSQFEDFSYDKACIVAEFLQVDKQAKLRQLSKGNRGRMKMAATLGREVPYYVMDEPFAGLDPIVREQLIKGLLQFTDIENQTILLSTHELYEVEPILDQIILLQAGSITAYEDVEILRDVTNKDAVEWMKGFYRPFNK